MGSEPGVLQRDGNEDGSRVLFSDRAGNYFFFLSYHDRFGPGRLRELMGLSCCRAFRRRGGAAGGVFPTPQVPASFKVYVVFLRVGPASSFRNSRLDARQGSP